MIVGLVALAILIPWQLSAAKKRRQASEAAVAAATSPTSPPSSAAGQPLPPVTPFPSLAPAATRPPADSSQASPSASPRALGAATVATERAEVTAMVAELKSIETGITVTRAKIEECRPKRMAGEEAFRPPARNPFLPPRDKGILPGAITSASAESGSYLEEDTAGRGRRLEALKLEATCVMKGSSSARVNGQVVQPGDRINGFVVRGITDRRITLEDDEGMVAIQMEGKPGL
jgi:hypothetical protein